MKQLQAKERLLVVGLTGSGKTFYVNSQILPAHSTVAVWDPHRNFDVGYFGDVKKVPAGAMHWGISTRFDTRAEFRVSFSAFSRACMDRRVSLVIVDEVVLLCLLGCEDSLVMLATQARNYGCALVTIAQRAYNVPLTVRSQTSQILTFQQTDEHDIAALNAMAGSPVFSREKLAALKQGQFLSATVRAC